MPTLKLSISKWKEIREDLHTQYPKTVFMIRDKMKRVLGFTVREHKGWVETKNGGYSVFEIHLDFFSDKKYTMFLMKYSEIIGKPDNELR